MQTKPNSTIAGDFNFGEEYFWGASMGKVKTAKHLRAE